MPVFQNLLSLFVQLKQSAHCRCLLVYATQWKVVMELSVTRSSVCKTKIGITKVIPGVIKHPQRSAELKLSGKDCKLPFFLLQAAPELDTLRRQMEEMQTMMRLTFEIQLDMQRSIRQEVAAALSGQHGQGQNNIQTHLISFRDGVTDCFVFFPL